MLKNAATRKLRLRVLAHSLGEYLYLLTKNGLNSRHRICLINKIYEDLGKQSIRKGVWYISGRKRRGRKIYRKQKRKGLPIGLIASAAPFLGETAKPLFKKFLGGGKRRQ